MRSFIHRKNIELYRKRLRETTDAAERDTVAKLLAEEEAKVLRSEPTAGQPPMPTDD